MAAPGKGGLKLNHLTVNGVIKRRNMENILTQLGVWVYSLPFFIGAD